MERRFRSTVRSDPCTARRELEGRFEIRGFVVDPGDLARRFAVELRLDGATVGVARADLFEPALCNRGYADGCYGFAFALPDNLGSAGRATVVIANSEHKVGAPIALTEVRNAASGAGAQSEVQWIGGLKFTGWIRPEFPDRPAEVSVFIDGACVAIAKADRWTPRGRFPIVGSAQRFEATLPDRFADGRLRRAHFRDSAGRELLSSPCEFVAFEDGLARFLERLAPLESEALRGRLFDKLMPQSIPFEEFEAWSRRFPSRADEPEIVSRVAVALIGERELDRSIASLERQEGCDWLAISLCDAGDGMQFDPTDLRQFLDDEGAACEIIVFAGSGTVFDPHALGHLAAALAQTPGAPAAYSDVAVRAKDGSTWPLAFPAFDYERMLEQGYPASFFAIRTPLAAAALEQGACDLYRMFNSCLDRTRGLFPARDGAVPVHAPGFLATIEMPEARANADRLARATRDHCAAIGLEGSVAAIGGAAFPAARLRRAGHDVTLSIVLSARGNRERIEDCLKSLLNSANPYEHEILVVGCEEDLLEFADLDPRLRRFRCHGPARLDLYANATITAASGEFLLFVDPDYGSLHADCLDELVSRMREPDVGAVGPIVVRSDQTVHSAGHVLGVKFAAAPSQENRFVGAPAYGDLLNVAHEASSIGVAGMMTRRDIFRDLDGFDAARFRGGLADVDYCLRLRARGYRIVVAPQARLMNADRARLEARDEYLIWALRTAT